MADLQSKVQLFFQETKARILSRARQFKTLYNLGDGNSVQNLLKSKFLRRQSHESLILSRHSFPDEDSLKKHAERLGLLYTEDLTGFEIDRILCRKIPYSFVKKYFVLPIQENDESALVGMCNPLNIDAIEDLRFLLKKEIDTVFVPKQVLTAAIHSFYQNEGNAVDTMLKSLSSKNEDESFGEIESYDLLDDSKEMPGVIRFLNFVLSEAIQQGSSDIHFEPQENGLTIRYRIDGVLQSRLTPSLDLQNQLLTRLKVMAKLDIAEKRLPQDGRIKLKMGGKEIDFRVSTLPCTLGERIVLRILDKGNIILGIDNLGMQKEVKDEFRRHIGFSEGVILVTGPTGSGKTTTLYSALTELQNDATNIMTIEDPVEYRIRGIAQMGVHPKIGLTFAQGLRHILRQDPDIIMVGEIRDKETAEIAIQSSLTGHLVLSTLHTNDAPSAITRLVDMGIEPYLISSCCIGILAQRLVRRLCSHCKESYIPDEKELSFFKLSSNMHTNTRLYRPKGCSACMHTGFHGRHGIYELMPMSFEVRKTLLETSEANKIKEAARRKKMISLAEDGLRLVLDGITTLEEVWRVTRQEE